MKNYVLNKSISYIKYLDANNLYWWAMSQKVPVGNFNWMTDEQCQNLEKSGGLPPSFFRGRFGVSEHST